MSHAGFAAVLLAVAGAVAVVPAANADDNHRSYSNARGGQGASSKMIQRSVARGQTSAPARDATPAPQARAAAPTPQPRATAPASQPQSRAAAPSYSPPATPRSQGSFGGVPASRMTSPSSSVSGRDSMQRSSPPSIPTAAPTQRSAPRTQVMPSGPSTPTPAPSTRATGPSGNPMARLRSAEVAGPSIPTAAARNDFKGNASRGTATPTALDSSAQPRTRSQSSPRGDDFRAGRSPAGSNNSPAVARDQRGPSAFGGVPADRFRSGSQADGNRNGQANGGLRPDRGFDGRSDSNNAFANRRSDGRRDWDNSRGWDHNRGDRHDWDRRGPDRGHNDWHGDWHGGGHNDWHRGWDDHHYYRGYDHHRSHWNFDFVFAAPFGYGATYYDSGYSFGLGFGSSSFAVSAGYGYSHYNPYRSYYYSDPLFISSGYCGSPLRYSLLCPTYTYVDPYPTTTTYIYTEPSTTIVYADPYSSGYSAQPLENIAPKADFHDYASPALASEVYVNNGYTPTPAAAAQTTLPRATGGQPTVYKAISSQGAMAWSDSPAAIVNSLLNSRDPAQDSQRYLGRLLPGGWEATLENKRTTAEGTELICRGTTAAGNGTRPTILVRISRDASAIQPGQRLTVIGRLTELSLNDPDNAGGLLVLSEGDANW